MHILPKKHRDRQRAVPVSQCALCGGELYAGCLCWRLGSWVLCGDCLGQRPEWALYRLLRQEVAG